MDLLLFLFGDPRLSAGMGIHIEISSALSRQDRNDRPVFLHGPHHDTHGIPVPAFLQMHLPVINAGGGQEIIQPLLQSRQLFGYLPLPHIKIS